MSELRHASDYSTMSGSAAGGYFSTPNSARHPTSRTGRFAQHKQYKKSKSLCTLETDIDDESFGPTSPVSPGGDELGMQRAPSAHDLRISKSLQKLNVPQWYSQSSLSKYGSLSLLKYGSNSTMSSWQQLPSSIISSPCTTPSASGNVVIKARVQPPTSARNLRSPRFPSKSAPTTPLFGSNGQANRSLESTTVKLPSDKLRSKEKAKALMPIPIVPFDKIRAMFEKKKSDDKAAKQAEAAAAAAAVPVSPRSPASPATDKSMSPTVASPVSFSPPPVANSPSNQPPRSLAINGRRDPRDEEDDVYEDVEIVVPKVIVSPTEPHVKGILKRPSQSEKRYSDIQEDPEDEEPPLPKPVPTRPVEAVVPMRQAHSTAASSPPPPKPQSPVSEPQVEYFFNRPDDRLASAPPSKQQPAQQPQRFDSPSNGKREDSSPNPPTPKPRGGGFSFFKKKLSPSSSSSSEKGGKKSPSSPANSGSPNTSYDSADKFPAAPVPTQPPSSSRPTEFSVRLEEAPVMRPPPTVTFPDEYIQTQPPHNHDVFPASSSTLPLRAEPPRGHVQETNIDDSSEGSAPTSPAHVTPSYHHHVYQNQPLTPPEPPASSPPPLATSSPPAAAIEPKPEKKRTWFPKPGKSRKASKSPATSDRSKQDPSSPQSPQSPASPGSASAPPNFQLGEMSHEPRRLRSSRSSGLDESFTSEGSRSLAGRAGGREQDRSLSSIGRPDPHLERSRDNLRPSRPVDLARKSSVDSERSFTRDLDRVSGRAAARAAPLDLDRSGASSSGGGGGGGGDGKRELSFRERRERDMRRYDPDLDDHVDVDVRRDTNKNYRDPHGIDADPDRRDSRNSLDRSRDRDSRGGVREDPRRYDMDSSASSASLAPRDRRSRELPDVSNADAPSRRAVDHVDVAIGRADRKPYIVIDDVPAPKARTWQPKPRAGRSLQQESRTSSTSSVSVVAAPVPNSNGTASRGHRYPVTGSAFSASKPNQASGLNTPPMARHAHSTSSSSTAPSVSTAASAAAAAATDSAAEDAAKKNVRETTV
ncbi:hypothetical protein EGW08_005356 [Elysia chlorotica]|uniref:Uncharacterized protein n=1 Tax=Elysia chlorotica TaxID=188477 RepID=A0A3S1BM80_ELYCH|nr:hypothetical protein EGW08_005356 [Elysia chlorotica]